LHAALDVTFPEWELVFVDDRSPDGSWGVLEALALRSSHVKAVRLSRNFGQHAAITAGLAEAAGRWIVVMDCDLQDPPEDIPLLYRTALEGHDIVFGRRRQRHEAGLRRLATRAYLWLANRFLKLNIDGSYGSFSIISDRVRDAFLSLRDKDRHYLFILYWLGFDHTSVDVGREPRHAGSSGYSFTGLIRHALDGIFFQTTVLLRWIVYFGFALSLVGIVLAGVFVANYFTGHPYPGWTSLSVLLLIVGGFIIMSTGVAGLYIGKIFDQVKDRPLYVVDRRVQSGVSEREHELA
jgi:glycosyltransferase involved in cell wall biosynthesis